MRSSVEKATCAYCGRVIHGEPKCSIHRDALGVGPEVPLCEGCGWFPLPTCEQIWERISTISKEEREQVEKDLEDSLSK